MNLKEQEYICTLAQCGSITKAAKQLFISQPALSAYVNGVEKSLGVELFYREGKQLRLTYAGELYVEKAEKMLAMGKAYQQEVRDIIQGVQGRICIGMQRRRGPTLVVEIMRRFQETYPNICLQFVLEAGGYLIQEYERGNIDILIYNDKLDSSYSVNEILMEEKVLLTVPRKDKVIEKSRFLPEVGYRWIDLKDVEDRTFIMPTIGQSLRKDCDRALRERGVNPSRVLEIGHIDTATQMAAEGLGVSFTRESYTTQFRYVKQPVFLAIGDPLVESPLYAIYRKGVEKTPHVLYIVQIIRQTVEEMIASRMN